MAECARTGPSATACPDCASTDTLPTAARAERATQSSRRFRFFMTPSYATSAGPCQTFTPAPRATRSNLLHARLPSNRNYEVIRRSIPHILDLVARGEIGRAHV